MRKETERMAKKEVDRYRMIFLIHSKLLMPELHVLNIY